MTLDTVPERHPAAQEHPASQETAQLLASLGLERENPGAFAGSWLQTRGAVVESINPATGESIGGVRMAGVDDYQRCAQITVEAFHEWRTWPAPKRGEVVRQLGQRLRDRKTALGKLVTLEVGKVLSEGLGEVQEMIDMADLAVGM